MESALPMTTVRLHRNGTAAFPAIFAAVDGARSSIALEMYIFGDDDTGRELREHLARAAARGVDVMVLVDGWGSWALADDFWDPLRDAGGRVRRFRPVGRGLLPFRDHRKLLLVDDRLAFVGGLNVADEYFRGAGGAPPWRDNALEVAGPEASTLRRSFERMWTKAELPLARSLLLRPGDRRPRSPRGGGVQFVESGPERPFHSMRRAYRELIAGSTARIDLAMGYFCPTGGVIRALRRAVRRGVSVRILLGARSDVAIARWAARGLYGRLLRAGIEVWEYQPAMLHAKLTIADDTVVAGSANLDVRSGRLNYELVAVVLDPRLAAGARADFEADLAASERVELSAWRARPFLQKLKERVSHWLLARADPFLSRLEIMRKQL